MVWTSWIPWCYTWVIGTRTTSPPLFVRSRRLQSEQHQVARCEFDYMLRKGICYPSASFWVSPLLLIAKKDSSYWPRGDYHRLNAVTRADNYPLPHLHDLTAYLASWSNTIFQIGPSLGVSSGSYCQIRPLKLPLSHRSGCSSSLLCASAYEMWCKHFNAWSTTCCGDSITLSRILTMSRSRSVMSLSTNIMSALFWNDCKNTVCRLIQQSTFLLLYY